MEFRTKPTKEQLERAKRMTFTEEDVDPFTFDDRNQDLPLIIRDSSGRALTDDELKERGIL